MPETRHSRSFAAALVLALAPVAAALVARGTEKPWTPHSPAYRQAGPADAPAVVVEFADFQCPHCAHAAPIIQQIEKDFAGRVRVIFKHRPWIGSFKWSKEAALAAECAGKQDKFWPMYQLLFSKQPEWSPSAEAPKLFEDYARSLKLDDKAYRQCVADPSTFASIEADIKDAQDHWVNSTPTFFVDGRRLVGAEQLNTLGINEIERKLRS